MAKLLLITKNYKILDMKFRKLYQKKKKYDNYLFKKLSDHSTSRKV